LNQIKTTKRKKVYFSLLLSFSQSCWPPRIAPWKEHDQSMVKMTDEVSDFTITDSDGNTWNLYDELSLGKTVFLDMFFTT